jgi:hypothetical protein
LRQPLTWQVSAHNVSISFWALFEYVT